MLSLPSILFCCLAALSLMTGPADAASTGVTSKQFKKKDACATPKYDQEGESFFNLPGINLLERNITIPGLSPLFPDLHCNNDATVCQVIAGEGEINAASSITALVQSSELGLQKTYFLIAGVGGIDPSVATIASVTFARFAVQVDLQYEFDYRETAHSFTAGYVPLGSQAPGQYPAEIYGTEVFQLNEALRDAAIAAVESANVTLNDTQGAQEYRALFNGFSTFAAGTAPPSVVKCDTITSNVFYSGRFLNSAFKNYTDLVTNGTGTYCMSQQEDNDVLEAILRGSIANKTDLSRVIIMRTVSNFIVNPPSISVTDNLFNGFAGYMPALENLHIAGLPIINAILSGWSQTYEGGVKPNNYVGDILGSLGGTPDFGTGPVAEPEVLTPLGRRGDLASVPAALKRRAMGARNAFQVKRLPSMRLR